MAKKLDVSMLLRALSAIGCGNPVFRYRGVSATCLMFSPQHNLTLAGDSAIALTPLSTRLVFPKRVQSLNAAMLATMQCAYMALSTSQSPDHLYGKALTLRVPGFELLGKLRASRFEPSISAMTGKHYCQFMLIAIRASRECNKCLRRSGGMRCTDECNIKIAERRP